MFYIAHIVAALFNVINSRIDAYRIQQNKTIAHAINFGSYLALVAIVVWKFKMRLPESVLFCIGAFFNRQISFDIPLNIRRGLSWYYQSTANPPKAILDRIENRIFGKGMGKEIAFFYAFMWVIIVLIKISFF